MKVWMLAGLFSLAAAPAFAAETTEECQVDETRRAQQRVEAPPSEPSDVRPTVAQREAPEPVARPDRRRNGKPIPDAELIGPRGAL